jgi:hypothetical protein
MRTLTNSYRDLQVINLDPWSGRPGPYLVLQEGTAPNDPECRQATFVLRPDGCWVDINAYLSEGGLEGLEAVLFKNLAQIRALLDRLSLAPCVRELPVCEEGLARFLAAHPPGATRERLRAWVTAYEARRDNRRRD